MAATADPSRGQAAARRSYPYLTPKAWWDLRRRFKATMPRGEVNAGYLASVLGIGEGAAGNVVPSLRALGLIDDANRPTDRANDWRDDERYREVTEAMFVEVYPQALRDVAPSPDPDRDTVERWFMRETGAGEGAAAKMALLYLLLAAGDPDAEAKIAERPQTTRQGPGDAKPRPRTSRREGTAVSGAAPAGQDAARSGSTTGARHSTPSIHIDIQVHIDPAATAEQIDEIFASMARHLYERD